jgi:hypothetical protein
MILQAQNNLDILPSTQNSYTSTNLSAGGTSHPVKNINSFSANDAIQIGKTGEEQAEILVISGAPSGTTINTSGTLRFDHPIDTPIYNIRYDKIIFKRSTAGTAGTATALTNGTVSITPDSLYTEFNDTSGATTYAYKTQFYNSASSNTSSESDWFVPGGPTFYSLTKLRQRVKDAMYSSGYLKSDDVVNDWINEWLEIMTNAAIKVNQGYSLGTATIAFGTAGYGTITDATFKQVVKVEVTYDGVNYVNSGEIPINQFGNSDTFSSNMPRHYWLGDTVFGILPASAGGTALITFSKRNTVLSDEADELPLSLRAYTTSCIDYALYRAYNNDQKTQEAESSYARFIASKNDFVSEVTPRDQTGVKGIHMVDTLSGMNDDITLETDYFI